MRQEMQERECYQSTAQKSRICFSPLVACERAVWLLEVGYVFCDLHPAVCDLLLKFCEAIKHCYYLYG